ncbi:hypothetical protein HDU98_003707 [Podochytrium sp. JEL0797]|nr:hypothetical protein HDU98_003707 [Podochytrium sp. JEL0797]
MTSFFYSLVLFFIPRKFDNVAIVVLGDSMMCVLWTLVVVFEPRKGDTWVDIGVAFGITTIILHIITLITTLTHLFTTILHHSHATKNAHKHADPNDNPLMHSPHAVVSPSVRSVVNASVMSGLRGEVLKGESGFSTKPYGKSVLVFHVWSSKSLTETLDVSNTNAGMVQFVKHILTITQIPLPVVTLATKYIQRLRRSPHTLPPTSPHRLFSITLILAQKYSDDTPFGNALWGKVLSLPSAEVTHWERLVLKALNWRLCVGEEEYKGMCRGVASLAREWNRVAGGRDGGWDGKAGSLVKQQGLVTPVSSVDSVAVKEGGEGSRVEFGRKVDSPAESPRLTARGSPVLRSGSGSVTPTPPSTLQDFVRGSAKEYGLAGLAELAVARLRERSSAPSPASGAVSPRAEEEVVARVVKRVKRL